MTDQGHVELQAQIGRVDAKCERILGVLEGVKPTHEDHARRIERLEGAVAKQNFIAAVFGGIGSAAVLAVRSLIGRG